MLALQSLGAPAWQVVGWWIGFLVLTIAGERLELTRFLPARPSAPPSFVAVTSVILAALFAPWGLGLFGEVSRWQAFAIGCVPVAAMLVWSPPWVTRMGQGPFERLWRAGARLLS